MSWHIRSNCRVERRTLFSSQSCGAVILVWYLKSPPRCLLCADEGYYLSGDSECLKCPGAGDGIALLVGLIVGILLLLVGSFVALVHPVGNRLALLHPARRAVAWFACYAQNIGLSPKVKIVFSFYGIVVVLNEVYDAQMPAVYTKWVSNVFGWVQFDWVS